MRAGSGGTYCLIRAMASFVAGASGRTGSDGRWGVPRPVCGPGAGRADRSNRNTLCDNRLVPTDPTIPAAAFIGPLKNQYHMALATLREAIELCPGELWLDTRPKNSFWQVAYHTLFFAHFYLGEDSASFQPWAEHQRDNQNEDGVGGDPDPRSSLPLIPRPYSKDQVLRYWAIVDGMVDGAVDRMDLSRSESGFHYRMSKLEHQLVNLRHVQHHAAQLADRLRDAVGVGVAWKGGSRPAAG